MKDMIGQEYVEGDYVFYATLMGKSPTLKFARVVKIEHSQELKWQGYGTNRVQTLVDVYKVGVKEIGNSAGYAVGRVWDSDTGSHYTDKTKIKTSYPNYKNMLKVDAPVWELGLAVFE